jgi:hypothetical protein
MVDVSGDPGSKIDKNKDTGSRIRNSANFQLEKRKKKDLRGVRDYVKQRKECSGVVG